MAEVHIRTVKYSHDAMIDQLIANPRISQGQLAAYFGYTPAWVSVVLNSDAFKERLAERRAEVVDPVLTASVQDRFRAVVERGLSVLQEKLSAPSSAVPDNLVLKAVELGAKGLALGGFGQSTAAPAPPPPNHLEALAQRLLLLQANQGVQQNGQVIEGEVTHYPASTPEDGLAVRAGEVYAA